MNKHIISITILFILSAIVITGCGGSSSDPICQVMLQPGTRDYAITLDKESGEHTFSFPTTGTVNLSLFAREVEMKVAGGETRKTIETGWRAGIDVDHELQYTENTYHVTGTIDFEMDDSKALVGIISYDLKITGGKFGSKEKTCALKPK